MVNIVESADCTALLPAQGGFEGRLSIILDRSARGRGILFHAARDIQAEDVVIMASCGGICTVTINAALAMRLGLSAQGGRTPAGEAPYRTSSVEAARCTETGISAHERALTLRTVGRADVTADDIVTPGHIMIEVATNIMRDGATLSETANLFLAASTDTRFAAWSDVLNSEGDVASWQECLAFAAQHRLPAYCARNVVDFGRERLKPWVDVVNFSARRFGD